MSVLLMIVTEHAISIAALGVSRRDACIALVVNRFFQTNTTVAVLTTTSFQETLKQPSITQQPLDADHIVQHVDLRWKFSFVILKLHLNNGPNCTCSHGIESYHAYKYFIIIGNGDEVATCIHLFCFEGLTEYQTRFVVYLNIGPKNAERNVDIVLENFWEHNHQNVVVLVTNELGDIDVYTWFPLKGNSRPEIVDKCDGQFFRWVIHFF